MSDYLNCFIDGKYTKIVASNGLKLCQKVNYEDSIYQVYRMRTDDFKMYYHLRKVNKKVNV